MGAPATTYEQEQEALQRELDGVGEIRAPKDPEVNPEVYKDVERLLFRGFLALPAEINKVPFVFKNLNHHEFELLRLCGGLYDSLEETPDAFWHRFLAYGVLLVDGQNVLSDRERWVPELCSMFEGLHVAAKSRIIRHMSEINRRASNAIVLAEAYAMESYSRYRWGQLNGMDLTAVAITGIEGTLHLGMNWAQQVWRAINYFEDRNDQNEREWENAKFIGSCTAGKGISKVYQQDTDRRQKDKDQKFARKDEILRSILLGEKIEETASQAQGHIVVGAQTVEELATQLESDLKGEKDWHDQVIDDHLRGVNRNIAARQQQLAQFAADHEAEYGDKTVLSEANMEGLTPSQVRELMTRRKQLQAQNIARRMVRPEMSDPDRVDEFMSKWGAVGPEVGANISSTDRDPSEAVPIITPVRRGQPFRGKK